MDLSEHQILTVEGNGEEFNTLLMNFGVDGGRNSLLHFKHLTVGELVLLKTEVDHQNHWSMAKVISCETDKNGMVRTVKLRVGKTQVLRRSVDKIVLLLENEMV